MDIDFNNTEINYIEEHKTMKKDDEKVNCYYYPGFTFKLKLVRDPNSKMLTNFTTTVLLGIFLAATFHVVEFKERLANLSIALLAYI